MKQHAMYHLPWEKLQLPKILGGLGLGNIYHRNIALLFKWIWCYSSEPKALWRILISEKYGYSPHLSISDLTGPAKGGPWKSICDTVFNHQ